MSETNLDKYRVTIFELVDRTTEFWSGYHQTEKIDNNEPDSLNTSQVDYIYSQGKTPYRFISSYRWDDLFPDLQQTLSDYSRVVTFKGLKRSFKIIDCLDIRDVFLERMFSNEKKVSGLDGIPCFNLDAVFDINADLSKKYAIHWQEIGEEESKNTWSITVTSGASYFVATYEIDDSGLVIYSINTAGGLSNTNDDDVFLEKIKSTLGKKYNYIKEDLKKYKSDLKLPATKGQFSFSVKNISLDNFKTLINKNRSTQLYGFLIYLEGVTFMKSVSTLPNTIADFTKCLYWGVIKSIKPSSTGKAINVTGGSTQLPVSPNIFNKRALSTDPLSAINLYDSASYTESDYTAAEIINTLNSTVYYIGNDGGAAGNTISLTGYNAATADSVNYRLKFHIKVGTVAVGCAIQILSGSTVLVSHGLYSYQEGYYEYTYSHTSGTRKFNIFSNPALAIAGTQEFHLSEIEIREVEV